MKLKLLLASFMLSAISANAQLATLNENFNNFTTGNTTFPQNGWSSVLPTATGTPGPLTIVFVDANDSTNKYIQSYSGANVSTPQYLVSPQIAAPTGNKSITFKARKNTASAPVNIQVGIASSPTDMSTFVALNSNTMLTTDSYQTFTIAVPSSTSTYLVIKTVSAVPAPHTVTEIDDFQYNLTSLLSVSDNVKNSTFKFAVNDENSALQFVGKDEPKNIEIYSALGQNVASGKLNNSQFDISRLQTGVYYLLIETKDGKAVKSKFIKK